MIPTEAQAEAGNYKKLHVRFQGLPISIETRKGQRRRPEWPKMPCHYGYLKRTRGADGDALDVMLGPNPKSELVVVVDQVTAGGRFDEHKCLLGFDTAGEAIDTYRKCYTKGWRVGPVTVMTIDQFKSWIRGGSQKQRIERQVSRYSTLEAVIVHEHYAAMNPSPGSTFSDREQFAALLADAFVDSYSAKKPRNSPGQLGMFGEAAGGKRPLRSSKTQSRLWDEKGKPVWRTINGARVKIQDGEIVGGASGKLNGRKVRAKGSRPSPYKGGGAQAFGKDGLPVAEGQQEPAREEPEKPAPLPIEHPKKSGAKTWQQSEAYARKNLVADGGVVDLKGVKNSDQIIDAIDQVLSPFGLKLSGVTLSGKLGVGKKGIGGMYGRIGNRFDGSGTDRTGFIAISGTATKASAESYRNAHEHWLKKRDDQAARRDAYNKQNAGSPAKRASPNPAIHQQDERDEFHKTKRCFSTCMDTDRPLFIIAAHEAGHALFHSLRKTPAEQHDEGVGNTWRRLLEENKVSLVDQGKVSEYATSNREELFCEVTAMIADGKKDLVPESILNAYRQLLDEAKPLKEQTFVPAAAILGLTKRAKR